MFKALERIVKSSSVCTLKKFAKFLEALNQAHCQHVAESLKKAFNNAGLDQLVTGQFPKVRMRNVKISFKCSYLTRFFWLCMQYPIKMAKVVKMPFEL